MADVYLIKEGSPHEASAPRAVDIETLTERLTPFEKRYYDAPPDIHPDEGRPAARDAFKHVLVRIHEGEVNAVFPEAGYYHVPNLTPEDCRRLFG